jgi:hypothetical protein
MSFEFYLGLVAAIPIGILTWIIQRRIEPFLNRRAERSLRSKISSLERELEFTRSIKNSIGINTFILETLLLIALVGAAGSIVTSFLYGFLSALMTFMEVSDIQGAMSAGFQYSDEIRRILPWVTNFLQIFVGFVVAVFIFRKANQGFRVYRRCINFQEFERRTMEEIDRLRKP